MAVLKKLKLGAKLIIGFLAVAMILVATGGLGFWAVDRLQDHTQEIMQVTPLGDAAREMKFTVAQDLQVVMELMEARSRDRVEEIWAQHAKLVGDYERFSQVILKGLAGQTGGSGLGEGQKLADLVVRARQFHQERYQPLYLKMKEVKLAEIQGREQLSQTQSNLSGGFAGLLGQAEKLEGSIKTLIANRLQSGATAQAILSRENTWADMAMELKTTLALSRIAAGQHAPGGSDQQRHQAARKFQEADQEFTGWLKALRQGGQTREGSIAAVDDPALRAQVAELAQSHLQDYLPLARAFMNSQDAIHDLARQRGELDTQVDQVGLEMVGLLDQVVRQGQREIALSLDQVEAVVGLAKGQSLIGVLAGLILALVLGFLTTRNVTRPLKATMEAIRVISGGDFSHQVERRHLERGDELGDMLRSLDQMRLNLSGTIDQVRTISQSVAQSANEISMSNQDLSERTQRQASAIEETASAMEELTSNVKQSATYSQEANQMAQTSAQTAHEGSKVVNLTVAAMEAVTRSSNRIADIINVVNEIAFQTNLLALNAAVEAARAGEAGRGFAVVAGEVRSLAGRSSQAAKEIQGLISDSMAKVEQGNEMVAESGRLLGQIIEQVQKVADTIGEISGASQEQAQGIDEVNRAVAQMDEAVQQNAAVVEQTASASENLASASQELNQQASRFVLERGEERAPQGRLAAPSPSSRLMELE